MDKIFKNIPYDTHLHPSCDLNGDIIIGYASHIGRNCTIQSLENTLIIGDAVNISEGVKITSVGTNNYTFICNNVEIEKDVQINNSTIEDDVKVKEQAVIMNDCFIAKGAVIGERTILTPYSRIDENQVCEPNSVYSGSPAVKIASLDLRFQKTYRVFRAAKLS